MKIDIAGLPSVAVSFHAANVAMAFFKSGCVAGSTMAA